MENSLEIKEQIVKNSFWGIISSLTNKIGGFILAILLSRLLMPAGFGKYSLAITISFFFITFSDLGINQTLIRYVSLCIDKNSRESALYVNYLFKMRFVITVIFSLVLLLIAYPLSYYIFKDSSLFFPFVILSIYVFFISLSSFFESLFFIKKSVKYISIKEFLSFFFKITSIWIIGAWVILEFRLIGIFFSFVLISIFSFLYVFNFSKCFYPTLFRKINGRINKKEMFKFLLFLNIQNISLMILTQASIIFLGVFLTAEFVGYYNSSWILVTGISSLIFSFSYILLPVFTNAGEQNFKNMLKKTFRLLFILSMPISFGLAILSKFFIVIIYGYDYLPASIPLTILAFLIPCMIGVDLSLAAFSARSKQKNFSLLMILSVMVLFILSFIFVRIFISSPSMILMGIALATLLSWGFCLIFSIFLLKKEFGINVISRWIIKVLFSCFVMGGVLIFFLNFFKEINIFNSVIIILPSALVYFISLRIVGGIETAEFREILRLLLNPKKK
ncbi:oligosaccharide flippase family protein [Candidatus Pacearchaeota archaeon]|nr:oligosaccharide flippase family protein [Candidatus Pacearchaeota archaeon]